MYLPSGTCLVEHDDPVGDLAATSDGPVLLVVVLELKLRHHIDVSGNAIYVGRDQFSGREFVCILFVLYVYANTELIDNLAGCFLQSHTHMHNAWNSQQLICWSTRQHGANGFVLCSKFLVCLHRRSVIFMACSTGAIGHATPSPRVFVPQSKPTAFFASDIIIEPES